MQEGRGDSSCMILYAHIYIYIYIIYLYNWLVFSTCSSEHFRAAPAVSRRLSLCLATRSLVQSVNLEKENFKNV